MFTVEIGQKIEIPFAIEEKFVILKVDRRNGKVLKCFANNFQGMCENYAKYLACRQKGLWIVVQVENGEVVFIAKVLK